MKSFKDLLQEVCDSGLNVTQIAAEVGCFPSNIQNLMKNENQEPKYGLGANIIALHKKRCGRKSKK